MAWIDLTRSINKACKILGVEFAEGDIPDSIEGLARLNERLWNQVKAKEKEGRKQNV